MSCPTRRAFGTPATGQGRTTPLLEGVDSSASCERRATGTPAMPEYEPEIVNPETDLWEDEVGFAVYLTEDTGAFLRLS